LTAREVEVLVLIAEGLANQEIARKLHVSTATVAERTPGSVRSPLLRRAQHRMRTSPSGRRDRCQTSV
ncbi:LuxR C-terminal-related transcriptional regulator, partial [Streptomyces sp. NPDC005568]|uniref:LuxR C-terminal-related transcriptional regulator n=1 Tax=Streptomyces sp. NPDC005568 TaxID=3156887 RepID=UPI0033A6BB05